MTTGTITHTIEDDDPPSWRDHLADAIGARLHAVDTPTGRTITNVIKTTRPRRQRQPGSGLISAGMVLLGLLDAGLLYVVFDAQDRFIFSVKHQGPAAMVQALALDLAMIIFSVLGLGLARRGLAASSERACIVVCAVASALMNWTASNQASLRSVAVYVSAPILLALTTDRTISVVRRHVLGMREDGSVWGRLGRALGRGALWALRLLVDFRATRTGVRQAIIIATPLPGQGSADVQALEAGAEELLAEAEAKEWQAGAHIAEAEYLRGLAEDIRGRLDLVTAGTDAAMTAIDGMGQRLGRLELDAAANGAAVYPSKKAHFLALYRQHGEHGRREVASRVAGELAEAAGLQPGTARAYVYEELARLAGDYREAGTHDQAARITGPAVSKEDHQ